MNTISAFFYAFFFSDLSVTSKTDLILYKAVLMGALIITVFKKDELHKKVRFPFSPLSGLNGNRTLGAAFDPHWQYRL